jgi:hypothetical protein
MAPWDFVVPTTIVLAMYSFGLYLTDKLTSWPWVVVGGATIIGLGALLGRPVRIGICEDAVFSKRGRRTRRIPADDIEAVELTWAPKATVFLVIRSASTAIEVRKLSGASEQFRRGLGQILPDNVRARRMSEKLVKTLFLEE